MPGLFTNIAQGLNDAHDRQRVLDREEEEKLERKLQRDAMLAHLDEQGYGVGAAPIEQPSFTPDSGVMGPDGKVSTIKAAPKRYDQIGGDIYRDNTRTAEGRAERKRAAAAAQYKAMGMSDAQAAAAADQPSIADNLLPKAPTTQQQISKRVTELMASPDYQTRYQTPRDRALAAAQQARAELGEAPTFNPVEVHSANRRTDVANPLPPRPSTASGEPASHKVDRQNATAVRGQVAATSHDLAAAQRAVPKQPAYFVDPADSVSFVDFRKKAQAEVARLRSRRDSLTGVLDRLTGRMQGQGGAAPAAPAKGDQQGALQAELQHNKARYDALIAAGADKDEALKAWQATNRLTVAKYQQPSGPQ